MKNKFLKIICLLAIGYSSSGISDTKIGIGSGINTGSVSVRGGVISIPIRMGSSFMVEPFFLINKYDQDADKNAPEYYERKTENYQIGLGIYGISAISNSDFEIYYGGTFGAGKNKSTTNRRYTYTNPIRVNEYTDESKITEYFVMPILGISYIVNENFLLSIDAGIGYSWGEGEETPSNSLQYSRDVSGTTTRTRLLFRYLF